MYKWISIFWLKTNQPLLLRFYFCVFTTTCWPGFEDFFPPNERIVGKVEFLEFTVSREVQPGWALLRLQQGLGFIASVVMICSGRLPWTVANTHPGLCRQTGEKVLWNIHEAWVCMLWPSKPEDTGRHAFLHNEGKLSPLQPGADYLPPLLKSKDLLTDFWILST